MTITYTSEVATCKGFGCFWKLLFRWKGSIYKLVWPELLVYTLVYFLLNTLYRLALNDDQKRTFEKVSIYCQYFIDLIPLSFVLGFYVSVVVQRWWAQYETLPWPDSLALFVSTSIHGQDERGRLMRRTIMRYCNLALVFSLTMISPGVKKRFPTQDHILEAGFMTANEQKIFDDLDSKTPHPKYWMPLVWAGSIVARARKEGRIRDDFAVKTIIDEINRFRGLCGGLLTYDWISIPLVYTQVVTLAVYTFFLGTIMGRQFLDPQQNLPNHSVDFYVPIFTFLQFFFYMGWLKVAESLVNPFGEDDDDFEVNWLVDRNLQVSYLIVDEMHSEHPELIQDMYWDEVFPQELPYTIAAEHFRREPPLGSTANIEVPEPDQEFLPLLEEEDEREEDRLHTTMSGTRLDLENNGTKAIDIIKKMGSSRSSVSSSQPSHRKQSMLSMIMERVRSNSHDNVRKRNMRPQGSMSSVRQTRRHRGLMRSSSRMSSASQMTCQSPESIARNPTIVTQDSAIFRMSDLSINTVGKDDSLSPRQRNRASMLDDDEPILIKIKRRDKDGRVIKSPSSEEFDLESDSSRAYLIPKHKKSDNFVFNETISDVISPDNSQPEVTLPPDSKSQGSTCSVRTSIFQGDEEENEENGVDERLGSLYRRRKHLKPVKLPKIHSTSSSRHGDLARPSSAINMRSDSPESAASDHEFLSSPELCQSSSKSHRKRKISSSEPVSPASKSPAQSHRTSKSLAGLDSPARPVSMSHSHTLMIPNQWNEKDDKVMEPDAWQPFSADLSLQGGALNPFSSSPKDVDIRFGLQNEEICKDVDEGFHPVSEGPLETIDESAVETILENQLDLLTEFDSEPNEVDDLEKTDKEGESADSSKKNNLWV